MYKSKVKQNRIKHSIIDNTIIGFDRVLRTLSHGSTRALRPSPATEQENIEPLNERERCHAASLMRVNHSGEVCAQALYQGQAITAKLPQVREDMEAAAKEELDHLSWCEDRLKELNARPSLLNPIWYAASFSIGAGAGLISDRVSLGFVAATENQVCEHLKNHMDKLPKNDHKSRSVIKQMLIDEEKHAQTAISAGGFTFPTPLKKLMSAISRIMTESSYRI